jgi:hypothetical protein
VTISLEVALMLRSYFATGHRHRDAVRWDRKGMILPNDSSSHF